MSITRKNFGRMPDGRTVYAWEMSRREACVRIISLGAAVQALYLPDRYGKPADVVCGYDDVAGYLDNDCFLGVVVGPSANRIAGGKLEVGGQEYQMPVNDGENNLHTDFNLGIHKRLWDAEWDSRDSEDELTLSVNLADGEFGLPGNRKITIVYKLTENALHLHYYAESDKDTVLNPTNHSYFNLAGHDAGETAAMGQKLKLYADSFTKILPGAIPTGELVSVKDTDFDFAKSHTIGEWIDGPDEQLSLVGGYDHNYVVNGYQDGTDLLKAAKLTDPGSGRRLSISTTLPGIQFYAGNCLNAPGGKGGADYGKRGAVALETQFFPDSVHHENFPSCIFGPEKPYESETVWAFSVC